MLALEDTRGGATPKLLRKGGGPLMAGVVPFAGMARGVRARDRRGSRGPSARQEANGDWSGAMRGLREALTSPGGP